MYEAKWQCVGARQSSERLRVRINIKNSERGKVK